MWTLDLERLNFNFSNIFSNFYHNFWKKMYFFTVESDVEEEEILQSSQESTENDLPEESLIFHEKVDDLDVEVLSIWYFDFFLSSIIKITNLI